MEKWKKVTEWEWKVKGKVPDTSGEAVVAAAAAAAAGGTGGEAGEY